jgi:predicted metal-dependent hydrolase
MAQHQYTLIRSKARRTSASLQVKSTGEVVVRAPKYMPKFLLDQFVKSKSSWILKKQAELQKPRPALVRNFTQEELTAYITQQVTKYSQEMSLYPQEIVFKQVKSYWGCCAPNGRISFNKSLAYAPKEAVTYIVVHELAHLKYRGHGSRFWSLVAEFYPDTDNMRKVLRQLSHHTRNNL